MEQELRQQSPASEVKSDAEQLEQLYADTAHWSVNLGEEKVHAKRMPGRFRRLKWLAASVYLFFFIGPYIRWEGRQALLFDIPERKFHFFGLTIWPQEVWIWALLLLAFFFTLYTVTAIAGRVFCGYFCWQTVWTDVYTWVEEKLEGSPQERARLDREPMSVRKFRIKAVKHAVFIFFGFATGITFVSYFMDVRELWGHYLSLSGPEPIWVAPVPFIIGTYIGVGFMREQICFWLCPYARIQGVMSDSHTLLPTYDRRRGEPRGKLKKSGAAENRGDCVDCRLCVAVCPTGIDIRDGQQEGCITCGLCLDACDTIMEKVDRPKGLVKYMSLNQLLGREQPPFYKRGRVQVYLALLVTLWATIVYGVTTITPLELSVIKQRQPLFITLSDGSIRNRYELKIVNKTENSFPVSIGITGPESARLELKNGGERHIVPPEKVDRITAYVVVPPRDLERSTMPLTFTVINLDNPDMKVDYESSFIGPDR